MVRRIVAISIVVAACTLAAGIGAANSRLVAARAAFDARLALASALIASASKPPDIERRLAAPDVHVVVEDHADNVVYEDRAGIIVERDVPPIPPGAPPPRLPSPPLSEIERITGSIVGRPPQRVGDPYGVSAVLAPNLSLVSRFLLRDVLVTLVLLAGTAGVTLWIATGLWRAARKELERTLAERNAAAKEYQRFLADAGHELRTPLTIVSGYVDILMKELSGAEVPQQILAGLRMETARMRALVEKMLLLARLDSAVSIPRLVDVADVAREVVAQMRARYPGREIVLRGQNATIVADGDDVHEAVRNLIENALRYAPGSPVEIDVAADPSAATITVLDRGEGIAPDEREHIFERFYRGKSRTDGEGSGLGLAIVSRVAEQWNGAVAVESQPGRTTFALRFPLAEEEYADPR